MNWKLVALIFAALAIVAGSLMLTKATPMTAATEMFKGSLGSPRAISGSIREMTPLLIAGLAVFIALRAGLFNIGVEGQLLVGAFTCAVVALRAPGPTGAMLGAVSGMAAGALWAYPAGLIKAYRNGHEVITTIMLNNIAGYLTSYLVAGPFIAPPGDYPATATLGEATRLGNFLEGPVAVNWAIPIGLLATAGLALWLRYTVSGYELLAVGANPTAARFSGVDPARVVVRSMLASGAIAGLAGALQVLAYEHRFYADFSPGYGFDALGVALLAGGSAFGVIPSAFVFGALSRGGIRLAIYEVPKGIVGVILGLMILIAAAIRYRKVKTVA
ncbi:MAG TPA: ABC transporter permease [Fimbriimonas sp.]